MPNYLSVFSLRYVYITKNTGMSTEQLLHWKNQGLTIRDISEQTGIDQRTLRYRYKSAGIEYNRSYQVNTTWDLSRVINPHDTDGQYLIGLLAADGYIDNLGKRMEMWVKAEDIELIERAKYILGRPDASTYQRNNTSGSSQVGMVISCKALVEYLITHYGFQQQKSRTLPFPRHLNNPMAYLRGFFDGEGYMGQSCTFTVASEDFVTGLLEWVRFAYGYTPNVQMC